MAVEPALRPRGRSATIAALALVVGLLHASLWRYGFLEEWGFLGAYQAEGPRGFLSSLPLTAGRPLHLVPAYLGLTLSGGRLGGLYAVSGVVAAAIYLAALWACRLLVERPLVRQVIALALALHPFWAAGWLLRFLPAQAGLLGVVLWWGCAARFLQDGRARRLASGSIALAAGLLAYQALALLPVLLVAALTLRACSAGRLRPFRRLAVLGGTTTATVGAVLAWSVVLVPRLLPDTYEAGLASNGVQLVASVQQVYATATQDPAGLLALACAVGLVLVTTVPLCRTSGGRAACVGLLALCASAPLTALVYASTALHLRDPERVLHPTTTALVLLASVAVGLHRGQRSVSRTSAAVPLLAGAAVVTLALVGLLGWQQTGRQDRRLLDRVVAQVQEAPAGSSFVLVDRTGLFGDVYTFLPPHLSLATTARLGRAVTVDLCTPSPVLRRHGVAARYPIGTTPDCEQALAGRPAPSSVAPVPLPGTDPELLRFDPS